MNQFFNHFNTFFIDIGQIITSLNNYNTDKPFLHEVHDTHFKSIGEKVSETIATESIVSFDITGFPVGLYYVTVTNENTVTKTKMIIR